MCIFSFVSAHELRLQPNRSSTAAARMSIVASAELPVNSISILLVHFNFHLELSRRTSLSNGGESEMECEWIEFQPKNLRSSNCSLFTPFNDLYCESNTPSRSLAVDRKHTKVGLPATGSNLYF